MKRMNAKYAGTCGDCGKRFPAGARIDYDRNAPRGIKTFHADCGEDYGEDVGNAAEAELARFETSEPSHHVMEITTASGTYYQRAGGRCEDAPCCGCCTF